MVHETASRGFGREAEAYERSRPSYPPGAVAWLVDHLRVRPDAVVADLAAGTGKLTRLLLPTGASVVAVEPVEAMRHVLHRILPSVAVVAGTAEAMPIRSASLDAVCAAQAFHWFDAGATFSRACPCGATRWAGRAGLERPRPGRRFGSAVSGRSWTRSSGTLRGVNRTSGEAPPGRTSAHCTAARSDTST
ncbi:MAG: class I SAM-dependent methyltransferase [Actinomycetes bacterium]